MAQRTGLEPATPGVTGRYQIPRIGQEVIVSFLEGDPDRPIITGRVYNAEQTVPYELPANATQSGMKSRSSKGGTPANFNEIRMEDKKGAEQLAMALGTIYQTMAHSTGILFENAVSAQQQQNALALAASNMGVMQIYSLDTAADAGATEKVGQLGVADNLTSLLTLRPIG